MGFFVFMYNIENEIIKKISIAIIKEILYNIKG